MNVFTKFSQIFGCPGTNAGVFWLAETESHMRACSISRDTERGNLCLLTVTSL